MTKPVGCGHMTKGRQCNKYCDAGDMYCPHHLLLLREQADEDKRRMEKARMGKERAALMRDMLPTSPLAAYNPKFDNR
jgi:hypothetical protein